MLRCNDRLDTDDPHVSLHAPEVECIGKGKAHRPYEFGVKVSVATTLKRFEGLHAKALPGSPYDGHTLATVIPDMEKTIGNEIERILADAGYRSETARRLATVIVHGRLNTGWECGNVAVAGPQHCRTQQFTLRTIPAHTR